MISSIMVFAGFLNKLSVDYMALHSHTFLLMAGGGLSSPSAVCGWLWESQHRGVEMGEITPDLKEWLLADMHVSWYIHIWRRGEG